MVFPFYFCELNCTLSGKNYKNPHISMEKKLLSSNARIVVGAHGIRQEKPST
jgi:hypothetical protein